MLLPQEIQKILDGCAVFDVATGEWAGNLRDRLLFSFHERTYGDLALYQIALPGQRPATGPAPQGTAPQSPGG